MKTKHILCEDCGHPDRAGAPNTRRCIVCRLLDGRRGLQRRTKVCPSCRKRYIGIYRAQVVCLECDVKPAYRVTATCRRCDTEATCLHDQVQVCLGCADAPENRKWLLGALARKRTDRIAG